jgi:hypothetical protein
MSGDEVFVLIASFVVSLLIWARWYLRLARARTPQSGPGGRLELALAPLLCAAMLFTVLRTRASHDVRDDPRYLLFYMALGAAWVGFGAVLLPLVGLSARDDVVDRGNRAAAPAISGALAGVTLAFAGGNVGDGPGWWVVVFAAGLASVTLVLAGLLLDGLGRASSLVTVERDAAAGLRLGAFFAACGLVLGRAAAGDWVSAGAAVRDFLAVGWPVAPFTLAAAFVDRTARPTPERPQAPVVSWGVVPSLAYVGGALSWILALGPAA